MAGFPALQVRVPNAAQALVQAEQIKDFRANREARGKANELSIEERTAALDEKNRNQVMQEAQLVGRFLNGVTDQASYQGAIGQLGRFMNIGQLPPTYDPKVVEQLVGTANRLAPPGDPFTLSPGQARFDAQGRPVASLPKPGGGAGGPFDGTGVTAQAWNIVLDPQADPSSPAYAAAFFELSKPRLQQVTRPDGTVVMAEIAPDIPPGIRRPTGAVQPGADPPDRVQTLPGTERPRTFNQDQTKAAGFASRAQASAGLAAELEASGFDPAALTEAGRLPVIGNVLASEDFQRYERAKRDFITAVLRRESGAAISATEFANEEAKFFPQVGDKPEVIADKAEARQRAIQNLIADSQGAFDSLFRLSPDAISRMSIEDLPATTEGLSQEQLDALDRRLTELGF